MVTRFTVGPSSISSCGGHLFSLPCFRMHNCRWRRRRERSYRSLADIIVNCYRQNHYNVLGVTQYATSVEIKRAYRLLARKWHPDVSKDTRADEVFKSVHLAYQVLSNEMTRIQYDHALNTQDDMTGPRRSVYYDSEFDYGMGMNGWSDLRQKMRQKDYRKHDDFQRGDGGNFSFYSESDEELEDKKSVRDRGSFMEMLQSAFFSLFLMQTVGCQLSITFSSLMAFFDRKLDNGYKLGYLVAWILGGRGGILFTLCLTFASWAFGKTNSSIVTLAVVMMWVGSNLASFAPLPQGALVTLVWMSVKLQVDLN